MNQLFQAEIPKAVNQKLITVFGRAGSTSVGVVCCNSNMEEYATNATTSSCKRKSPPTWCSRYSPVPPSPSPTNTYHLKFPILTVDYSPPTLPPNCMTLLSFFIQVVMTFVSHFVERSTELGKRLPTMLQLDNSMQVFVIFLPS